MTPCIRCQTTSADAVAACAHILDDVDYLLRFTGVGTEHEYLCRTCIASGAPAGFALCRDCLAAIGPCLVGTSGRPAIDRRPSELHFTATRLPVPALSGHEILAVVAGNRGTAVFVYTADDSVWRVDLAAGDALRLAHCPLGLAARQGHVQLVPGSDDRHLAVTSSGTAIDRHHCLGSVLRVADGTWIMPLDCGDYHTCHADFPVAFVPVEGRDLLVHATDWNRIDVTDLSDGRLITARDPARDPRAGDDRTLTEWAGTVRVSPGARRIATIGWVWHPVGVAFSWDLQRWIGVDPFEADSGASKRCFGTWSYLWHGAFAWIDDRQLCIWGFEDTHDEEHDLPLPSAAIYDAESGDLLRWFPGPTMDLFEVDHYLFSGLEDGPGISVWSLDDGALLAEHRGFRAQAYVRNGHMFVDATTPEAWGLLRWSDARP